MADQHTNTTYKPGDIIGQKYEIRSLLGSGGFGDVYLVYHREFDRLHAMKTPHKELLADDMTRKLFQKEANTLVELEPHPYLVRTYYVEEFSGLLFITMEYVAPNEDGINTLLDYLQKYPLSLAQSLRWAIQICYGMEYAYSKGIKAHRDIKPENIMLASDGTPKISDFGLAGILEAAQVSISKQNQNFSQFGKTQKGAGFGTLTHMPPEQFYNAVGCDQRSDVYSFGITLFQMATGGKNPFALPVNDWQAWLETHSKAPVPELKSPLYPIILRCLEKSPDRRYQSFEQLRIDAERLLKQQTGEVVERPQTGNLNFYDLSNKGVNLLNLGRYEESIRFFDDALEINPHDAVILDNKGTVLARLERYEESIRYFDKALEIEPRNAGTWSNKGSSLNQLGRYEESMRCFDKSLEIEPNTYAWANKGILFDNVMRYREALYCYDKALELDSDNTDIWNRKGGCFNNLGHYQEAIYCFDKILKHNPRDLAAWNNKGNALNKLGYYDDSVYCYDMALEIDPHDSTTWSNKSDSLNKLGYYEDAIDCLDEALRITPNEAGIWNGKGMNLGILERYREAFQCFDRALAIDARNAMAWNNKGNCYRNLKQYEEAVFHYNKSLEIDSRDINAWNNKGNCLIKLGRYKEAIYCLDRTLEIDSSYANAWHYKGDAFKHLGHYKDALHAYKQFIALAPAHDVKRIQWVRQCIQEVEGLS